MGNLGFFFKEWVPKGLLKRSWKHLFMHWGIYHCLNQYGGQHLERLIRLIRLLSRKLWCNCFTDWFDSLSEILQIPPHSTEDYSWIRCCKEKHWSVLLLYFFQKPASSSITNCLISTQLISLFQRYLVYSLHSISMRPMCWKLEGLCNLPF